MKMKRVFLYLLGLFLMAACSDDLRDSGQDHLLTENDVILQTKGVGDNSTYIFYLIGNQNGNRYFGTYVDAVQNEPLMPGYIDAQNGPTYDSSKGLRAVNGNYSLFAASPAQEMVETSSGSGLFGYSYTRNDEGVYVSEPVNVILGGVYLSGDKGAEYIYDASAQVLRQPRSRLKLKFACGSDIEQAILQAINLKNFISEGIYIPYQKRFHYENDAVEATAQLYPKTQTQEFLQVTQGNTVDLDVQEFILSMNYGETDSEGNTKYPMPSLEIITGASTQESVTFNAVLGWDFKPQHTYEFTIKINSIYVNMTVKISSWDSATVGSDIEDTQTWQVTFPFKDGTVNLIDWEKVDKQTGTIS